jgi:uncharacterized membrane protein
MMSGRPLVKRWTNTNFNMELMKMIPVLVVVGGLGIAIGIYITSQIGEHINRRTTHKKFLRNMEEFDKRIKK